MLIDANPADFLQDPFIATFKTPFKFSADDPRIRRSAETFAERSPHGDGRAKRECDMGRYEINDCDQAGLGESAADTDTFFELGMMYSSGHNVAIDYVTAHKWFNLAAMRGHVDAIRLRREIAAEMTEAEVASAQRAARDWMKTGAPLPEFRAAA
jgi:TPR repeat protein